MKTSLGFIQVNVWKLIFMLLKRKSSEKKIRKQTRMNHSQNAFNANTSTSVNLASDIILGICGPYRCENDHDTQLEFICIFVNRDYGTFYPDVRLFGK